MHRRQEVVLTPLLRLSEPSFSDNFKVVDEVDFQVGLVAVDQAVLAVVEAVEIVAVDND